jgi:inhibitor of cysteine peptidase
MNMKKISLDLLTILLIVFSVALFANGTTNMTSNAGEVYTEDKPNVAVSPEQPIFIIQLKSNPTTGFSWFLREYDNHLIMPVKHSFQPPTKNLMGAPGFEFWTFRVMPAGFTVPQQTTIRMVYARPWQGSDSSTQLVFRVTTTASTIKP